MVYDCGCTPLQPSLPHLQDVIEVYLDDGHVIIPDSVSVPSMPWEAVEPVRLALARVLDPAIAERDHAFHRGELPPPKSLEFQVSFVVTSSPL